MSDFGRTSPSGEGPSTGDWWRYAWLSVLGLLVLLLVFGRRDGGFVIVLAVALLVAAGVTAGVLLRRSRSEGDA